MYLGYTDLMLNELSSCFNPHTLQTLRGLCLLKCPSKAFQNMANSRSLNLFVLNNDGGAGLRQSMNNFTNCVNLTFLSLSIISHHVLLWMQPATFDICLPVKRPMHKGLQNFD